MKIGISRLGLVLIVALTGCAPSLAEMRAQPAHHQEDFPLPPSRLADCALNSLTLAYGSGRGLLDNTYSFSRMTDGETIHLVAQIDQLPMWDLALVATDNGGTRVEARASKNI